MAHEHGSVARREAGLSVGEIARAHGERVRAEHALSPEQHKVLRAIERCRTAALGGHLHKCPGCDYEQPRYNSCRNRHCPGCQSLSQLRWRERILDVGYFHVVFTIPEPLRALFARERRVMYGLLMEAARRSLLAMAADPKRLGALPAITLVLHTWTRELLYHPHVHAVVSAGGYDLAAQRWIPVRRNGRYLFPVRALAKLVRGVVREAILRLAEERLVEVVPKSGTFVARIPMSALPEAIVARRALEGVTVRAAAQHANRSQVTELVSLVQRQEEAAERGDPIAFHRADEDFHAAIARIGRYPGIWDLIQQVKVQIDRYRRLTLPQEGRMDMVAGEHLAVVRAIEAGDADLAVARMEEHLDKLQLDISVFLDMWPDYFVHDLPFDERLLA